MPCRGVYFALSDEDAKRLRTLQSDDEVLEFVQEEIEGRWDEQWLQETDKAWDAIHRCLGDGTLKCKGRSALEKFVLCGEQLYGGSDYIISFLKPAEVRQVYDAATPIAQEWFRQRYFGLGKKSFWKFNTDTYDGPIDEDDFEYSWNYFQQAREFFKKAADAKRAVIFSVDQ